MRLINVDTLMDKICTYKETGCGSCKFQECCPNDEVTAYDVGKVILEIVKSYGSCENCNLIKAHECNSGNCQIKEIIDIVRNGDNL